MSAALIQATHLTQTAQIERLTRAADGFGGWTESWSVVVASVPCNVQFRDTAQGVTTLDERQTLVDAPIIRFPPNTNVQADDRVTVAGMRYRVLLVRRKTRAWTDVAICRRWGDE